MNKNITKLFATIIVTAMLLGTMPLIMSANAVPTQGFYITPTTASFTTATTSVGDKFNVTVWIVTTVDTFSWQAAVNWNTSQIKADAWGYTSGGTSQFFTGHSTTPVNTGIDNSTNPGSFVVGEALSGSDFKGPGTYSLVWIEFEIVAAPAAGQTLTSSISFDNANSFALDTSLGTEPNFTYESCLYSYAWAQPTTNPYPNVVNPTTNTFGPFSIWNGTTFDELLYANNVNVAWCLTNATADFLYNGALLKVSNVVYDPLWLGTNSFTNVTGHLTVFVQNPSTTPSGNVLIATVTMTIIGQGSVPPQPFGAYDTSVRTLSLTLYSCFNTLIPVNPQPTTSPITVYAYSAAPLPWLSVSSITLGPGPALGQLFNVTITLNNVTESVQHLIGIQYRLQFDSSFIMPVAAYEGPMFPYFAALEPGSLGTFWFSSIEVPDGIFGPNVVMANMVYPNSTGQWNEPLPDGTGVVAIVTFQVVYQSFGEANTTIPLHICDQAAVGLDNMIDQNIVNVPLGDPVNGTYTITTSWGPGRMIDLYGGAVNSNLITLDWQYYRQFVPPYGGQGPNAPMDLVEPQSWVYLNANVTYNYWPVQCKNVAFEIQMPDGSVYNKLSALTDSNGVASIGFRMPWPCTNQSLGVWKITATVELADVVINDTMSFHYDYLIHIWKVTTDMFQYTHSDCVQITFEWGSHAQQTYPVLFVVSIVDELGVTVGIATVTTTFGGTVYCQYLNHTTTVEICLPKWAYAGIATIHINAFNIEPSEGGVAIATEYVGPQIAIQPY